MRIYQTHHNNDTIAVRVYRHIRSDVILQGVVRRPHRILFRVHGEQWKGNSDDSKYKPPHLHSTRSLDTRASERLGEMKRRISALRFHFYLSDSDLQPVPRPHFRYSQRTRFNSPVEAQQKQAEGGVGLFLNRIIFKTYIMMWSKQCCFFWGSMNEYDDCWGCPNEESVSSLLVLPHQSVWIESTQNNDDTNSSFWLS